jgi:hypothetical protein
MDSLSSLTILSCGIAAVGLCLYALRRLGTGRPLQIMLRDFKRKIWMTIGLGGFFFSLYFIALSQGASLFKDLGREFFIQAAQNPLAFIYGGLWVFAMLSLSIYLVRIFIKYLYLAKGKDS